MKKIYKEPNKSETETTINVLYSENILSICTNKVDLQKKLNKLLGEPAKEHKIKRSIAGSTWNISLDDKTKIQKVILKANMPLNFHIKTQTNVYNANNMCYTICTR